MVNDTLLDIIRRHEGLATAERMRSQANVVGALARKADPMDLLELRHYEGKCLSAWYALHSLRLDVEQAMAPKEGEDGE